METWNQRLAQALEASDIKNPSHLAAALGIKAPTVSAWIGAGNITPAKDIKGDNLLRVCTILDIRPEWLMFREGPMRPRTSWPFSFSYDEYMGLPDADKAEIENAVRFKLQRREVSRGAVDALRREQPKSGMGSVSTTADLDGAISKASSLLGETRAPNQGGKRSQRH